jgi:hypothetical protein
MVLAAVRANQPNIVMPVSIIKEIEPAPTASVARIARRQNPAVPFRHLSVSARGQTRATTPDVDARAHRRADTPQPGVINAARRKPSRIARA